MEGVCMRLARRGIFLALALMLCRPAFPAVDAHPLDPLTAQEHWVVYDVLRASGHVDEKTRYAGVRLKPPPKAEVLAWRPGQPIRREAFATLVKGGKTYDAVVDLVKARLVSWQEAAG